MGAVADGDADTVGDPVGDGERVRDGVLVTVGLSVGDHSVVSQSAPAGGKSGKQLPCNCSELYDAREDGTTPLRKLFDRFTSLQSASNRSRNKLLPSVCVCVCLRLDREA